MSKRKKISKKKSQSMFKKTYSNIQSFNLMPKPQRGGYRV
ncbi:DNA binding protein [Dipodfec virus RodF1_53]|uniref:DNA binding protein n=1 Tax=Dipodfec virus RodF1_53 TaxID=2929302 RepID=A0A976N301_9VIRU|nr:DNA binding protein [Dipodfec virus RodF1_53]